MEILEEASKCVVGSVIALRTYNAEKFFKMTAGNICDLDGIWCLWFDSEANIFEAQFSWNDILILIE